MLVCRIPSKTPSTQVGLRYAHVIWGQNFQIRSSRSRCLPILWENILLPRGCYWEVEQERIDTTKLTLAYCLRESHRATLFQSDSLFFFSYFLFFFLKTKGNSSSLGVEPLHRYAKLMVTWLVHRLGKHG